MIDPVKLRHLDVDDMMLVDYLLHGEKVAHAARLLGLTPPAASHRLRKIEEVFDLQRMIEVLKGRGKLRLEAVPYATKLSLALHFLTERFHGKSKTKRPS